MGGYSGTFHRYPKSRWLFTGLLVLAMAMFMRNEGASAVLSFLGVTISNDAIQHLYDRIEFKDNPDVEEVGIDDVATRKGQKYATAIYDLKDYHLIALFDGRDGFPLKEWLKNHKKIRLVARDASTKGRRRAGKNNS